MRRPLLLSILLIFTVACTPEKTPDDTITETPGLISGIDLAGMDTGIRPQDDFYGYANGTWLTNTEIPGDEVAWGSYFTLRKQSLEQLREIVETLGTGAGQSPAERKIGDFYQSYLNETHIEELGIEPIKADLEAISGLDSHAEIAAYFGSSNRYGVDSPLNFFINQDDKDATRYIVFFTQSGLGLPDRDYYFDDSERGEQLKNAYRAYIEKMLTLSGINDASTAAARVLAVETRLAEHHWDKVTDRDAEKTYNKVSAAELAEMLPNYNLDAFLAGLGVGPQAEVIVREPSYAEAVNQVLVETDLESWKDYLQFNLLQAYADFLPKAFGDARHEFYGQVLTGRAEQRSRWQKAIFAINSNMGELLGQLYVEKYFPPEAKARMMSLVDNLIKAYEASIRELDWMSETTKAKALEKLAKFTPKIGYPDKWRDYSELQINEDDLIGNIRRARSFNHDYQIDKLGKPIDRGEWHMPPQTVNAYYNPGLNEIVFPAAYLQPPNFFMDAEDAVNYGAIGTTIGHEIGHGFDDQGSKYDGDGNLKSWWTQADREKFEKLTARLVAQYNQFEVLPGLFVNGELTLGENIGDLGGTSIAYKAYLMSLDGKEPPVMDGFTAAQRFFLGQAQSGRVKWRPQMVELLVKSDPHAPDRYRTNGVLPNVGSFYPAFDVKPGDNLYLPPEQRVRIW